jgi:HKD family nuclease
MVTAYKTEEITTIKDRVLKSSNINSSLFCINKAWALTHDILAKARFFIILKMLSTTTPILPEFIRVTQLKYKQYLIFTFIDRK